MDKNTKMLLGVGAVAVVGYLVYQQMNKNKSFYGETKKPFAGERVVNASGRGIFGGSTSRTPICKKKGTTLVPVYNSEGYVSSTKEFDACGNLIRTYLGNVTSIG